MKVDMYTDGAYKTHSGLGGWGVVLKCNDKIEHFCGGESDTTNNRMEMLAVIKGLEKLPDNCIVDITTDSRYVLNGITKWIIKWKKRGWKTAKKEPVKNKDLWERLYILSQKHIIKWHWVKGHNGHPENELADKLANKGVNEVST